MGYKLIISWIHELYGNLLCFQPLDNDLDIFMILVRHLEKIINIIENGTYSKEIYNQFIQENFYNICSLFYICIFEIYSPGSGLDNNTSKYRLMEYEK